MKIVGKLKYYKSFIDLKRLQKIQGYSSDLKNIYFLGYRFSWVWMGLAFPPENT